MQLTCVIWKIHHIQQLAEKHVTLRLQQDQIPVLRNHIPLFYILPENGEGMLFHDLVANWGLSKSSISEIVARYEAMGYVSKLTCGEDKRSVNVHLSREGMCVKQRLLKIEADFLDEILKGYSDEEREQFNGYLDQVIRNGSSEMCCHRSTLKK